MSSFERLLAQKLADPAVKAGFDDAARRRRLVEELVEARKEQGLTQKQVGKLIGVSQSTVAEFETGGGDPRLGTIQRYAPTASHERREQCGDAGPQRLCAAHP